MTRSKFSENRVIGILKQVKGSTDGVGGLPRSWDIDGHKYQVEGEVWRLRKVE